ncbi:glycosyltransferase family A protein [Rickettsiella endosymbiont of Dermanyssus gallinae]|uniref:glycosyltransferase family A protein n=1 Tax=Rickettsiella endosymbiont of Dermanyssus gallinae TaxID=2856608 RepID=UPI001C533CB5|nr:glycosyltransferase family A protein [Rickettsiella endosymbiont of Dermanyssus gallinae]
MSSNPFFSIIIPTRNRPDMLRLAVSSLLRQKFNNFEIIISDNSDAENQAINFKFIQQLHRKNLSYIRPNKVLSMHDNWEFALDHAKGLYVGVLIDKTVLRRTALKEAYALLNKDLNIDILNYCHGGIEYHAEKLFKYKFQGPMEKDNKTKYYFDPKQELVRRFSLKGDIRQDGKHYILGKICFGFYSARLINKIKSSHERVFFPVSCDYTSCVLALAYADKAMCYEKVLLYSVNNFKGNGYQYEHKSGTALAFLKDSDLMWVLNDLPIANLYGSLHNFCSYDYNILNRLKIGNYAINKENLIRLCKEDLQRFQFSCSEEQQSQWKILLAYEKEQGILQNAIPAELCSSKNTLPRKRFREKLYRYRFIQILINYKIRLRSFFKNIPFMLELF